MQNKCFESDIRYSFYYGRLYEDEIQIIIFGIIMSKKNKPSSSNKITEAFSYSSQSHESEEQIYAGNIEPKKQQKQDAFVHQLNNNKIVNIEVQLPRQSRPKIPAEKPKKSEKRRSKCNAAHEGEQIKKEQKKRSAAPPQLVTDGSKSSSSKSDILQKSDEQKAAPDSSKQSKRLYIGNLPLEFSESQLRKLFKKYGHLKEAKLAINNTTGKSKGFGFIQYGDINSAIKAKFELCCQIIDGLKMTIEFCQYE